MTISLSPEVQKLVEKRVKSGEYKSPDEAVNALLAQAICQEIYTPEEIKELRALVAPALAEADAGDFVEFTAEDVIARKHAALKKAKHVALKKVS